VAGGRRAGRAVGLATAKLYFNLRRIWKSCYPERAQLLALDELACACPAAVLGSWSTWARDNLPAASRLLDDLAAACATTADMCGRFAWGRSASGVLSSRQALYMNLADLETLRQRIEDRIPTS